MKLLISFQLLSLIKIWSLEGLFQTLRSQVRLDKSNKISSIILNSFVVENKNFHELSYKDTLISFIQILSVDFNLKILYHSKVLVVKSFFQLSKKTTQFQEILNFKSNNSHDNGFQNLSKIVTKLVETLHQDCNKFEDKFKSNLLAELGLTFISLVIFDQNESVNSII